MTVELPAPATRIVWPDDAALPPPADPARPTERILGDPAAPGAPAGAEPSVVLDFGLERHGGVRSRVLEVRGAGTCRLRVRLGESVTEALVGGSVDHDLAVEAGSRVDVGETGFRFARVDARDPGAVVRLALPEAYDRVDPAPRVGSFACSDPRLDRIWEVGARTVHLGMQGGRIWDGIKRGRTVWAGDLWPAARAVAAVFGPHPSVGASLDHLRDATDPALDWMNGIPAYSLWWVIAQADWFGATGDLAYLRAQHGYLAALLARLDLEVDAAGREHFEGWRFLDWATARDDEAIDAGTHGLLARALRAATGLAARLGDPDLGRRVLALRARVEARRPPVTASKAAASLLALGGLADPVAANRAVLAPDPAAGLTPFLGLAVLDARALAGDHAGALDLIRAYWGAMLDLGATTFWEDFDLGWAAGSGRIDAVVPEGLRDVHRGLGRNARRGLALSLCHPWSAGPTPWLSRHVLGITPLEPGHGSVRIGPALGDLAWAEGVVPTPLGPIRVRHERRPDGSVATEHEAPPSIRVDRAP